MAERIFRGVYSGKPEHRPQLGKLLKVIKYGDELIITRLERIARSPMQGVQWLETLSERDVIVEVLNMRIIDDTQTGRLKRNIIAMELLEIHSYQQVERITTIHSAKLEKNNTKLFA